MAPRAKLGCMPDNVQHHILIRLPPPARLALAQAVPGLRAALLTSFPRALDALGVPVGTAPDDPPPATPPHLPDALRRAVGLAGPALRALRLHAGLSPLQTRVLLETAADRTPSLRDLSFADAGAVDRRLAIALFRTCAQLESLAVHHATDLLLRAFDRLPLSCTKVTLTGVSFAALQWVQAALQTLSDDADRAETVDLTIAIVEPLLPGAPGAPTSALAFQPRFRNVRLLKAFFTDLSDAGTWLCAALRRLTLRHRAAAPGAQTSGEVGAIFAAFTDSAHRSAALGSLPLPPYTALAVEDASGDMTEILPERTTGSGEGASETAVARRGSANRIAVELPDLLDGVLSGELSETELCSITSLRVTWGSAHYADLDDEDGAQLQTLLSAHCAGITTMVVDDPLQTPRRDAATGAWQLPCLRLAARLLGWLPGVRRLTVSRHVLEYVAGGDAARLVAACARLAELRLVDPFAPRAAGRAGENIRAQARNLPACLSALGAQCTALRSVALHEAPDRPRAGVCDAWRDEIRDALSAVETFELERGDVDICTVRWQVEMWKAVADAA